MIVISFLTYAIFLMLMAHIVLRRRAIVAAGFFFLFPLVYRATDIVYLDLFGPLYAQEVGRYVGGNVAAPMFLYAACALIVPLLWTFPDRKPALVARLVAERAPHAGYHRSVATAAFIVITGILAALTANLVIVGTIPLLEGIDRLEYNLSAGRFHNAAYELTFLLSFTLGAFTVLPRLNGRAYDLRFALLAAALLFYWVLTGNRFSIFFTLLSFYFMPLAAVIMVRKAGLIPVDAPDAALQRMLTSSLTRTLAGILAVVLMGGLIFNSYYNVRSYRDPLVEIQERVLVQPVQLWATAWDRVDFSGLEDLTDEFAFDQIVFNPIDARRNTTIQFLITQELGFFRSAELVELGQQYNGGYPEVHFELFNPWLALLTLPLAGLLTALFLRLCLTLLLRNLVVSSVAAIYLFFGISLHYAGGSVTFFLATTYWLKALAFAIILVVETRVSARRGAAGPVMPTFPAPAGTGR